jgi:alkanesulfonate monooxygenase SsuD/methylene tetrahydromethanopterin reductase-like flavin-dependent oxidoreductase (luciferase family)
MSQEEARHMLTSHEVSQRPIRERVGVWIEASNALDAITRIREAEQAGISQIWSQNFGFADVMSVFTAAATQTSQIRLGTAIVPTYPRHPLALGQQALAIYDIAPGRLRLGVGPGNPMLIQDWFGLPQPSPLAHLKEYVEMLRGFLWENATYYQGEFFHMSDDTIITPIITSTLRKAPLPVLVSAVGPRAFRLAGEVSDGALSYTCPIPYLLEQALPALRAGAEAHKRPAPPLLAHVTVAMSTDEEAVLAVKRQRVQMAARIGPYARTGASVVFGPYARMFEKAGFADALEGDEKALDALARTLVISGDEVTVQNKIKELLASGLDELMLQLIPITDEATERKQLLHLVGSL